MNFNTNMECDKADDPLAIGSGHLNACIANPCPQPVDAELANGIEHDFDDICIVKPERNCRTKRCAQHTCAARKSF